MKIPSLLGSRPRRSAKDLQLLILTIFITSACSPGWVVSEAPAAAGDQPNTALQAAAPDTPAPTATPWYSERPRYAPGELVDYTAQPGDTLAGLAVRFNTTVDEILLFNSFIPRTATTMPAGMPMKIPIYYLPLWGSPYHLLPDSLFPNGPAQVGFDIEGFISGTTGWLNGYEAYVADANRSGAEIIEYIAHYYSVSPRLLLALLEYQAGALSDSSPPDDLREFPLGNTDWSHKGLFLQLGWASNQLNSAYYRYRMAKLTEFERNDGRLERIDPWQNAASVALMSYFNDAFDVPQYQQAISPDGFIATYTRLFGDPWQYIEVHLPGSLEQPQFLLPFEPGDVWALTGGPHTGWGLGEPYAALDFAPPSKSSGCQKSDRWATAVAEGVVVRSEVGQVMLDLDGDGDERTGWNVFYLHIGSEGRIPLGARVRPGDPIGHPSCEGGSATGTHIHIARKYNGEWMPAEGIGAGVLAFNLEGWTARNGSRVYLGTLVRNALVVTACTCSNARSWIQSDRLAEAKATLPAAAASEERPAPNP